MKRLSIVVPIYNNALNIPHTIPRLLKVADSLKEYEVELILVDDGSGDDSFKLILDFRNGDKRVKAVKLSKNFGSMIAMQAGLDVATGDCVCLIMSDLQDPPELLPKMVSHWEKGIKVVIAVREKRSDGFLSNIFANTFHYLMANYALKGWPNGGFDFVLMDKQVVEEMKLIKEKNRHTLNLIYWLGYDRMLIPYTREKRLYGKSQWTFSKKIKLFIDSFISFSYVPIRFISFVGIFTALISFIYGIFVFISYLFGNIQVRGYTPLVLIITFLLGLIMIMLGIIGEYLWRVLDESRSRPLYVIDEKVIE